jgi:light-regulated signal transduction histidine kinase (bacteriophytochrome)
MPDPNPDCPLPEGTNCAYRTRVEQLEEDLEQFAYLASHDLREPLTGLAGFATLLQSRCDDQLTDDCKHFLKQIIEGTKRMEEKLEDLLAFSRAGRAKPTGAFPLGQAIEEARRALVRSIAETKATINIKGELPVVEGDRSMIAQVFQNLFSNSLKYRRGDKPPRILIEAEPHDDGSWRVAVRDNGIGFDMRYQERVFGVFQRLYTIEEYPGTGIGLAIARKVIERHGGTIWTWSKPDQGATFYFTLPPTTARS